MCGQLESGLGANAAHRELQQGCTTLPARRTFLPFYLLRAAHARCRCSWNQLAHGSAEYCAVLVALNSVLQVLLYAPLALFYLVLISRQSGEYAAPFWLIARSALIFLGIPLAAALVTRDGLIAAKRRAW